jgi:protein SCO1/2
MRPRPSIALLGLVIVLLLALGLALILRGGGGGGASTEAFSRSSRPSGFEGAALPPGVAAPDFTLTDQLGRSVSLSAYRGQVTMIAFVYSTCGASCTVIAQQIRGALDELARPVPVLLVSADPSADTPGRVGRFLQAVSLAGRVRYLTGPLGRLRSVWRAYRIAPAASGRTAFERNPAVLLIDGRGRERVLFGLEQLTPESLAHDIRRLDGEPTRP